MGFQRREGEGWGGRRREEGGELVVMQSGVKASDEEDADAFVRYWGAQPTKLVDPQTTRETPVGYPCSVLGARECPRCCIASSHLPSLALVDEAAKKHQQQQAAQLGRGLPQILCTVTYSIRAASVGQRRQTGPGELQSSARHSSNSHFVRS